MDILLLHLFFFGMTWHQQPGKNDLHGGIHVDSKLHEEIKEVVPLVEGQIINCLDSKNRKHGLWVELRTDTTWFEKTTHWKGTITYINADGSTKDSTVEFDWEIETSHNENTIFLEAGGAPHYDFHIVNDSIRVKYTVTEYGYYENNLRSGTWADISGCYLQHTTYVKGILNGNFAQFNDEGQVMYWGIIDPGKTEQEIHGFIEHGADDTLITWIPFCLPMTY